MSKKISEEKLKAFSIGSIALKKSPFEIEKERKENKKREEELAAAKVFEEFMGDFDDVAANKGKTFVRGDVIVPKVTFDSEEANRPIASTGEYYTLDASAKKGETKEVTSSWTVEKEQEPEVKNIGKKIKTKKMSNLEAMKERLKKEQEEREMRHALKQMTSLETSQASGQFPLTTLLATPPTGGGQYEDMAGPGGSLSGDTTTTNIYVGNIPPSMTEEQLCQSFGQYGPLASVKVMWPRTPEEHARGRNCGFVAFMNRSDAEKAYKSLDGKAVDADEFDLRLGWGKPIAIPPQPFYVHPAMPSERESTRVSGLPFNARPQRRDIKGGGGRDYGMVAPPNAMGDRPGRDKRDPEREIMDAEVYVVAPRDNALRRLIHKMVEFVVREGTTFEGLIMHREYHNPLFRFLFDSNSPEHCYYRWKLFSVLQGDRPHEWRTSAFRMFRNGSWWMPPRKIDEDTKRGQLSVKDRDELESILRHVEMNRDSIKKAMGFCLDHSEAAEEIVECVTESLCILETPIQTKIARFFVVSDLLHNTGVVGASYFRKGFETSLPTIMQHMNESYFSISGRMRAEYFKKHVTNVLNAWGQWFLYPRPYLDALRESFLLAPKSEEASEGNQSGQSYDVTPSNQQPVSDEDVDGEAIDGEDIDGEPLPTAPMKKEEVKLKWAVEVKAKIDSKWDEISDEDEDEARNRKRGGQDIDDRKAKRR